MPVHRIPVSNIETAITSIERDGEVVVAVTRGGPLDIIVFTAQRSVAYETRGGAA